MFDIYIYICMYNIYIYNIYKWTDVYIIIADMVIEKDKVESSSQKNS